MSSGSAAEGIVQATWRRRGATGTSIPACRPSTPAQAPAAFTTVPQEISPLASRTFSIRPSCPRASAVTSSPKRIRAPNRRAPSR